MFHNHFKIAIRQLRRNKIFSVINILGLSLGMALAILIVSFILGEFSFDHWMADSDRTYRVYRIGNQGETAWTPGRLAEKMQNDYPEVDITTGYAPRGEQLLTYAGNNFYVEKTAAVDSSFFSVLPLHFLHGNPATAMSQPNSMVISDKLAKRIFQSTNPIGEVLQYGGEEEFMVTGVVDHSQFKSHIDANIFTRFRWYGDSWIGNNRSTYVRLKPSAKPEQLAAKIEKDVNQLVRQQYLEGGYTPTDNNFYRWALQPLNDIYLQSEGWTALPCLSGSMRNVWVFALIALLVLLVAIINYVNLTTARATQRSKEIGVKKVVGAGRPLLTRQFLIESVLQALLAGTLGLILAEILLPLFNQISERELQLLSGNPTSIILTTLLFASCVGLLAGAYPAWVLSAFQPVNALKSSFQRIGDKGLFRKVLVSGQFAVSITLLVLMGVIYLQVQYMMDKELGFHPDQVLVVPMNSHESHYRVEQLKSEFKRIPGVEEVTTASTFPGRFLPDWPMLIEGRMESVGPLTMAVDDDFARVLQIEMVAGRFLDDHISGDSINNFVVNEEFVRRYNISDPIGERIKWSSDSTYGQIVGVMKDFHYRGVADEIMPLVVNARHWRNLVGFQLSTTNLSHTIASIEKVWTQIEPLYPMRHSFLDEDFDEQYNEQRSFARSILYTTLLTIFIALLGLFGLTSFAVERRTREIGIRKILGASVHNIIGLLSKDFVQLVAVAFVIASPLAYYLSNSWLSDFSHRISLSWWIFVGAGALILLVGFLTVSIQSLTTALAKPVDSLRNE
ncbi:MAG: ABC transporter permease [Bacteroidota bacterium]